MILLIFILGYIAIAFEHQIRLNKAASALIIAVLCWTIYVFSGVEHHVASEKLLEHMGEISGILFFLMGAMTIVELIDAHDGFDLISSNINTKSKRKLLWIVTGIAFLLTTFLAPLVAIIPYEAATPALIIVGFLMMSQIKNIGWDDLGIGIPAFLTIILMPFTYNISVGIGAGFITHVVIRLVQGRVKEVHPLLLLVSGLFMIYFLQSPINALIG
jgi:hypothetical protein